MIRYGLDVFITFPRERRPYSYATQNRRDEMARAFRRAGYKVETWVDHV